MPLTAQPKPQNLLPVDVVPPCPNNLGIGKDREEYWGEGRVGEVGEEGDREWMEREEGWSVKKRMGRRAKGNG